MTMDLRKKRDEEEEKKKGLAASPSTEILNQATQKAVATEEYANLPEAAKKQVEDQAGNPNKLVEAVQVTTENRLKDEERQRAIEMAREESPSTETAPPSPPPPKEEPNVKDSFLQALTFFLPTIGGAAIGGAFEGSAGAFKGAQMGMEAGKQYRDWQLEQMKLQNPLAQQRLALQQGNLEARKQELQLREEGVENLETDRSLRRTERVVDRAIKTKEAFTKRDDVKKVKERLANLDQIETITKDAPEIAAGVIPFKIAKGIAGEVGNLTQAEREDAQISPSFLRKLQRGSTAFLTGKLPKEDVQELLKVVQVLKNKENSILKTNIKNFSESRSKMLKDPTISQDLEKDLYKEFGLNDEEERNKQQTSIDKYNSWDVDKQKRYNEYLKRRNKK